MRAPTCWINSSKAVVAYERMSARQTWRVYCVKMLVQPGGTEIYKGNIVGVLETI